MPVPNAASFPWQYPGRCSPRLRGLEGGSSHPAQSWCRNPAREAVRRSGRHQMGQAPVAALPLIESSRAASGRQNTAVTQSARMSRHNCPRARGGGPAPWGGGVTLPSMAIPPYGYPCVKSVGTTPETGMSRALLGVREPGGAGTAKGTWAMGAVGQDSQQCCWHCQSPVMHGAAQRFEGAWVPPKGGCVPLHGGSGLLHPARACGAHCQAGARGRSGW